MTDSYRIIGPPGTGKTGAITRTVAAWVDRDGYKPEDFVLTSFTRSAASVLNGRIEVPRENIATLHALAYRALGSPPMAEGGDLAKRWNEAHQHVPAWQVGSGFSNDEDGLAAPDAEVGQMLRDYSLLRAKLTPVGHPMWAVVRDFQQAWEDFKVQTESIDFCDMLMNAIMYVPALEQPIFIVDEAQDLVPLQWELVRQWGARAERFMVAGDAAQAIYNFAGARPDELLAPLPSENYWPLSQSYRMPRAILEHAERYLSAHSGRMMEGRTYRPREQREHPDAEGVVRSISANWRRPEEVVDLIESDGMETMILASCSYMLQPVVAEMRRRGISFGNRYRMSNGLWNPLASLKSNAKKSTAKMVRSFVKNDPDDKAWIEAIKAEVFAFRSAKKMIEEGGEDVSGMLLPEHRAAYETRDLDWYYLHMLQANRKPAEYAIEIVKRHGVTALDHEPNVTVGSIHSVKGGESARVIAFPDISQAGQLEQQSGVEGADSAVRLGYVALTRASEELVLCSPANPRSSLW